MMLKHQERNSNLTGYSSHIVCVPCTLQTSLKCSIKRANKKAPKLYAIQIKELETLPTTNQVCSRRRHLYLEQVEKKKNKCLHKHAFLCIVYEPFLRTVTICLNMSVPFLFSWLQALQSSFKMLGKVKLHITPQGLSLPMQYSVFIQS